MNRRSLFVGFAFALVVASPLMAQRGGGGPVVQSGSFTASFDVACTTTPTVTYDWTRVGNLVTMTARSQAGFVCTGDTTTFATSGTPVPAAIRPAANVAAIVTGDADNFQDNSVTLPAVCIVVALTGEIGFRRFDGANRCATITSWTAAANRHHALNYTVSWMLGNP